MITAQRAFDANAQVITTANQESQTVIQVESLMDRGLFVAMTGAKQIMQAQAVNNHNLANVSTVGFRADAVAFTSQPIYGPGYATRVNAVAGDAGTDFSSGVLSSTGNPLDISVNGKGFIAVQAAGRQGGLHARRRPAPDGRRRAGHRHRPAGAVGERPDRACRRRPPTTIGSDGTISVVPLGLSAAAQSQVDRIKLVNPPPKSLQKGPDGLLRVKAARKVATDETVTVSRSGTARVEQRQRRAVAGQHDRTAAAVRISDQEHELHRPERAERRAPACSTLMRAHKDITHESRTYGPPRPASTPRTRRWPSSPTIWPTPTPPATRPIAAAFQDLMYQNMQQVGAQSTQNTQYSTGLSLGTGVRIAATEKNYPQGSVLQTSGNLGHVDHRHRVLPDYACRTARSPTRATARSRSTRQGNVVTASGYPTLARDHDSDHRPVGHRRRGRHGVGDHGRQRQGDHGGPGAAREFHQRRGPAAHRQQPAGRVGGERRAAGRHARNSTASAPCHQGSLETSNVNTVTELVNMIECQRAYEMNSKAISTTDQMLQYLTTNLQ